MNKYITYLVANNTTVDTLIKLEAEQIVEGISKKEFLKFTDDNGHTNCTYIFSQYSKKEQLDKKIIKKYLNFDLDEIKENTLVNIPLSNFKEELKVVMGDNLFLDQTQKLQTYFLEKEKELLNDPKYVKVETVTQFGRDVDLQMIEENCQVWLYVKAIDKLLDISPFVNSLSTQKSDIGSFSINLSPIEIKIDRDTQDISAVFISNTNSRDYLNQVEIISKNDIVNKSFFEKYCQQNDAIFIRFEKLQIEENSVNKSNSYNLEVDKSLLPKQIFDMIGLVDNVHSSVNFSNSDYSVNISGRDLMKTIIDDGAYVMDLIYAQGAENMLYYIGNEEDSYFKRNFAGHGAFEYLFKEYFDPIKIYMGFIVNQLSNVGWTGDNDLFNFYPEETRPKKYKIGITDEKQYLKAIDKKGVWKIIHLKVDPMLDDRRIIDGSFIDQDGTLYEQFKKACQEPFVDFWGDTYGSEFNLIARQQPFDKQGMANVLKEGLIIDVENKDVFKIDLNWETEYYSWFQFFPSNQAWGDDKFFYSASFPIIYLDKYVENFGNRRKVISDNYVSGKSVDSSRGVENKESMTVALFNDLKYIIESYSVLPFTRSGTIVINGDRRIKRGSFIRLKATKEICYVDSVSNSLNVSKNSIDRTTTLVLKRCMDESHLKGTSSPEVTDDYLLSINDNIVSQGTKRYPIFNYYNIINSDLIIKNLFKRKNEEVSVSKDIKVKFGVNNEVFDYFLKRKQLDYYDW